MLYQKTNERFLTTEKESLELAYQLADLVHSTPFLICFYGDFGVGKTFISRAIIHYLLDTNEIVNSPTFTLLNIYENKNLSIYHYDLHRLKSKDEIYELSIEEALENHLTLIEWPEIIEDLLPKENRINVEIKYNLDGNRFFRIF